MLKLSAGKLARKSRFIAIAYLMRHSKRKRSWQDRNGSHEFHMGSGASENDPKDPQGKLSSTLYGPETKTPQWGRGFEGGLANPDDVLRDILKRHSEQIMRELREAMHGRGVLSPEDRQIMKRSAREVAEAIFEDIAEAVSA